MIREIQWDKKKQKNTTGSHKGNPVVQKNSVSSDKGNPAVQALWFRLIRKFQRYKFVFLK